VRKIIRIAAIVLPILLTALAAVTVQFYRHSRDEYRSSSAPDRVRELKEFTDTKIKDSLGNASDALRNLQIYAADYVLTGRADSLKVYQDSLQDWQYESGTLELVSADDGSAALFRDFSQTGSRLADEMAGIVSLYDAGSHGAALDRLRTGPAMMYRDKIDRTNEAARKALIRARGSRSYDVLQGPHRLLYCAGGLYLLGILGAGLLLCLLRATAGTKQA
jgi:CHASE3 domain sensor protein